jgi:cell division septum initiation protein DivIVA
MQRIANEHSERMASAELQLGLALPKLQPAIEDVATMLTEMRKSKDRLKELEARMAESSDRVDKWQRRGASEGALVLQRIDAVQVGARLVCVHRHAARSHTCWHAMVRPKSATSRTAAELTHPPSVCAS